MISLLDVGKFYNDQVHQQVALGNLTKALPKEVLSSFAKLYRNNDDGSAISLVNAFKYYKGLEYQVKALQTLQTSIPANVLTKFATEWRAKPAVVQQVTKQQVEYIFNKPVSDVNLAGLNLCMNTFLINTPIRKIQFVAQVAHESGGLQWLLELGNAAYFTEMYEDRSDLGNIKPGDGVRFSGLGPIQLTGRNNYQAFANYIQDQKVMEGREYCLQANYAFAGSGYWWTDNDMNRHCDNGETVYEISGRVNRGSPDKEAYHMDERLHYFYRAANIIPG